MIKIIFAIIILSSINSENEEIEKEFNKKKIFFSDSSKINLKITPKKPLEKLKIPLNLEKNENLIKISEKIKEKNEASCNFKEISQSLKKIGPKLEIKKSNFIKYDKKNKTLVIYDEKINVYYLKPRNRNSDFLKWEKLNLEIFNEIELFVSEDNFFAYENIEKNFEENLMKKFGIFIWNSNILIFDFFENNFIYQNDLKIEFSKSNKIFILHNFGDDRFKFYFFIYESNNDIIYIYEFDLENKILNIFQKFNLKSFFKKSSLEKKNNFRVFNEYKPQMEINVIYAISEKKGLIKFKENSETNIFEYEKKNLQFIEGQIAKINNKRIFIVDKFKNNSKLIVYRPYRYNTNLKM